MKQEVLIRRCETIEDFEIAKTITHDYMIWLGMDLGFKILIKNLLFLIACMVKQMVLIFMLAKMER